MPNKIIIIIIFKKGRGGSTSHMSIVSYGTQNTISQSGNYVF